MNSAPESQPFVGYSPQLLTESQLRDLLEKPWTKPSYYFLKWSHQVSGIVETPNALPSPEGQRFSVDSELRWKWQQRGKGYEVLLLTVTGKNLQFKPIGDRWLYVDRPANFLPATETRFLKRLRYPNINIAQRYFIDAKTSTVHFVALTVGEK